MGRSTAAASFFLLRPMRPACDETDDSDRCFTCYGCKKQILTYFVLTSRMMTRSSLLMLFKLAAETLQSSTHNDHLYNHSQLVRTDIEINHYCSTSIPALHGLSHQELSPNASKATAAISVQSSLLCAETWAQRQDQADGW